jgi:hypothetical protein
MRSILTKKSIKRSSPLLRAAKNVRSGRLQRTLSFVTAASALPLGFEVYVEHYRGSFGDKWMWVPIAATPVLVGSAAAATFSKRAATTALPLASAIYAANGLIGIITHVRGVARKPGGFAEPTYNIVMGPPLLAPGSLTLVGGLGLLAAAMRRER